MKRSIQALALIFILMSGCASAPDTIRDVRDLPQDHTAYLSADLSRQEVIPASDQALFDEAHNTVFFSPWQLQEPFHALTDRVHQDFARLGNRAGFGENKRLHPPSWYSAIERNAALKGFPNSRARAITTRNTNLRVWPTQSPHFNHRDGDASAWPFDNLQRSSVPVNTPVWILHVSADKSWALVETSFTFGWLPVEDLAYTDADFIARWMSGRYAVVTRDFTPIRDENGQFLVMASVGHIFPRVGETADRMEVLVALPDATRTAIIRRGFIAADAATPKPLRLDRLNAVRIANELMGEPYGWGGLYGRRDCSAMTRDFFAVFGIWLPRHSADQVKEVGTYINLEGLSPEEKERVILAQGVPYLSLLWRRGHVMLYIGGLDGKPLIFHNVWGVRTVDLRGRSGRKVIGQSVITTLEPGRELRNIDTRAGSLLSNISAMNILVPPTPPAENVSP